LAILQPVVYFLTQTPTKEVKQALGELLGESTAKSESKLHLL
jgi:hypothetical protein